MGLIKSKIQKNTDTVKRIANELGFFYCGISKSDFLEDESRNLETYLKRGNHGEMSYLENHYDKRLDTRILVEDSKSVISLLLNYYNPEKQVDPEAPKISQYAYGEDYHLVIKEKLKLFITKIEEEIGEVNGRAFVDSAPVMDKAWAKKSGLGWLGKNTNLIHPKEGSFFFIAELILDLELNHDGPIKDYCGTCTKCIDACPTDALYEPYKIDAKKCISYLTIELKDNMLPEEFKGKMDNWMFGCDICQDVCPWNRFSKKHNEPAFNPKERLLDFTKNDWQELTQEVFSEIFKNSAVKRTKFKGLERNIGFLKD